MFTTRSSFASILLLFIIFLLMSIALPACSAIDSLILDPSTPAPDDTAIAEETAATCPATQPLWVKPADDPAVDGSPGYGYYYVNSDGSIWASAWWTVNEEYRRVNERGVKVGWFRPAGAKLVITGQRLDGSANPLHADVPCCYPTRFQASGLLFPTDGCWEVTARAADSELTFIVMVYP